MFVKRRTTFFFLASLCAFVALIISGIAVGTSYWIEAGLERDLSDLVNRTLPLKDFYGTNPIDADDPGAFRGRCNFGLLQGCKKFNWGLGGRDWTCFKVFSEHEDVYSVGYPIACFIFLIIAIIFALVSTIFGLVNTLTVPIETIHGVMGLYLWNAVGAAACLIAWVVYLILYLSQLTRNVLNKEDMGSPNNFRTTSVNFGFSFWLVVVSFFLFLLNILFVFLAHLLQDPNFLRKKKKESEMAKGSGNTVGLGLMY
ncbi:clarin-1-like [Asterias rubens]|uniref:clarin-1-like n=1 Tax=Asterias rubens TaxID=7604 RepID=UPI001454FC1C|nr:clarin-1-like [Asterias rubens]